MRDSVSTFVTTIILVLAFGACAVATTPTPIPTSLASQLVSSPPVTPSSTPLATQSAPPPSAPIALAIGSVASGARHSCVVTGGGGVKCWGANESGQLGDGTTRDSSRPVDVAGLGTTIKALAAGGGHTCALTTEGGVKCWGDNGAGQLGNGADTTTSLPVAVANLDAGASAIAAGGSHSCAVMTDGGVKCWGANDYKQLGDGTTTNASKPGPVLGLASGIAGIVAGDIHSCALTIEGGVKCWGYEGSGGSASGVAADVPGLASGVTSITAGYERTCALTTSQAVKCWGGFDGGRPVELAGSGDGISAISAGFDGRLCAVTTDGAVKCWSGIDEDQPIDVPGLDRGVTHVAAGGRHTCAVVGESRVSCWGDNWSGQLGDGRPCSSWSNSAVPVTVGFEPPPPAYVPPDPIDHATGPTDVVLRFDRGPDIAWGDLVGELFQPGPEFTLYGDGTAIFRNELDAPNPAVGRIVRGRPFLVAHLDEAQVQTLLRFALGDGGLGDACESYGTQDTDVSGSDVFTIRAGGVDKRVEDVGSGPFGALADHLRNLDRSGIATTVWAPDRYRGSLLDASVFANIGDGTTPGSADAGTFAWPWPTVKPTGFEGLEEGGAGRRIMSADEVTALSLSEDGGVVQRVYLRGPAGKTIYYFSLWPMLPDEGG